MAYGVLKVDTITFTDNGSDVNVSVSGLAKNPTFTGDVTATGTISGANIQGGTLVSGATVTGNAGNFSTVTGISGVFTTQVSGVTITGDSGNFSTVTGISGVFTTQISGATITGDTGEFTTLTGGTAGFTTVTGTTVTGTTANFVSGVFTTQVSGVTITGDTGEFTTLTGGTAGFTTITGTTVTGTTANFVTVSGTTVTGDAGNFTTATVTSGVFASGTAGAPSVSVGTTNNGLYSPDTNQVALSTNGTGRLFINSNGQVLSGTSTEGAFSNRVFTVATSTGTTALELRSATNGDSRIVFTDSTDSSDPGSYKGQILYDQSSDYMSFNTNGNNERLRITSNGELKHLGGGTEGSPAVYFAGSAPSNSLYVQAATGNVGIGTSSPGRKLSVQNSAVGTEGIALYRNTGDGTLMVGLGQDADGHGEIGVNNTSGTRNVQIRGNGISYFNGGNVGIGTDTPNNSLVVSNSNKGLEVSPGTTNTFLSYDRTASSYLPIRTRASTHTFSNGSSDFVHIDSSGRLLVGTPNARSNVFNSATFSPVFQVEGAASTVSRTTLQTYGDASASGPIHVFAKHRSTSVGGNTIVQANDECGRVSFQGSDGSEFVELADIRAYVDGTPGANDMPGRLVFSVTQDGGSSPTTSPSAMTINSGQEVLIGYSTDNGAYKLQVNSQIFATSATIATSDGRYKENVAALDGCVDLVKALRPVSFDWKAQEPVTRVDEDGETVVVREAHNFPDGKQVGFIAQEVEEVLADKPWLGSVIKQNVRPAVTDADGNELAPEEEFLGIAEGNLVAVLTSALKDAIGRIESLEAEVAALKA